MRKLFSVFVEFGVGAKMLPVGIHIILWYWWRVNMARRAILATLVVIVALSFTGCATIPTKDSLMSYDTTTTVVVSELSSSVVPTFVVGGWNERDMPLIESFAKQIPGAISVLPERRIPISTAGEALYLQIIRIMEERGLTGPIFLVLGSWAGLPGRFLAAKHPELVMGIITIGTPVGGYPKIVNRFLFGADDDDCDIHLYLIAGYDETLSSSSKIWMTGGDLNDGLLGLNNVRDVGNRKIADQRIFPNVRHLGLFKDPRVINQVNTWINREREIARNKAPEPVLLVSGAVVR